MLKLYRRHLKACPHTSYNYRRCSCPVWVRGTLGHTKIRMSLDQTDWDAANRVVGNWTATGVISDTHEPGSRTIKDVADAFLADAEDRGLAGDTRKKYKLLLTRLEDWALTNGYPTIGALDVNALTQWRATWPYAALAKQKTQERVKAFFGWVEKRKWIDSNPAMGLSSILVRVQPTLPFTNVEQAAILNACDRYPTRNAFGYDNRARMKAFILLLRWTGLRIRDVVTLEWSRIVDGRVFLYTQKTGTPVWVPVPDVVSTAVNALPRTTKYVFWSGVGLEKSAVADWQRALRKLFELADVKDAHAHRFRDTFAVECLLAGVDIQDVAVLLGHASVKTTERSYSPWVSARQTRLEAVVQRTWSAAGQSAPSTSDAPAQRLKLVSSKRRASSALPARA
jgi:integrase/recombinase XerD